MQLGGERSRHFRSHVGVGVEVSSLAIEQLVWLLGNTLNW